MICTLLNTGLVVWSSSKVSDNLYLELNRCYNGYMLDIYVGY